jgi:hypothetical protein
MLALYNASQALAANGAGLVTPTISNTWHPVLVHHVIPG